MIRSRLDKSFVRWMPHVNLLYPFHELVDEEGAASAAYGVTQKFPPFQVTLKNFGYFAHSKRSFTLWLQPESPSGELEALQETLWREGFPMCEDLNNDPKRNISAFCAHLSLGQFQDEQQLKACKQALEESWPPTTFDVDEVAIITRKGYLDPFSVRAVVPLTASASIGSNGRSSSSITPAIQPQDPIGSENPMPAEAESGPNSRQPNTLLRCEAESDPARRQPELVSFPYVATIGPAAGLAKMSPGLLKAVCCDPYREWPGKELPTTPAAITAGFSSGGAASNTAFVSEGAAAEETSPQQQMPEEKAPVAGTLAGAEEGKLQASSERKWYDKSGLGVRLCHNPFDPLTQHVSSLGASSAQTQPDQASESASASAWGWFFAVGSSMSPASNLASLHKGLKPAVSIPGLLLPNSGLDFGFRGIRGNGCLHITDKASQIPLRYQLDTSLTSNSLQQAEKRFGPDVWLEQEGSQQQGILGVLHLLHIKDITALNLNTHEPWPCEVQVLAGIPLRGTATTRYKHQAQEQQQAYEQHQAIQQHQAQEQHQQYQVDEQHKADEQQHAYGHQAQEQHQTHEQQHMNQQHEKQQVHAPHEVTAITFVNPPDRLIPSGLAPPEQVVSNMQSGATAAGLGTAFQDWLAQLPKISDLQKDPMYNQSSIDGKALKP